MNARPGTHCRAVTSSAARPAAGRSHQRVNVSARFDAFEGKRRCSRWCHPPPFVLAHVISGRKQLAAFKKASSGRPTGTTLPYYSFFFYFLTFDKVTKGARSPQNSNSPLQNNY